MGQILWSTHVSITYLIKFTDRKTEALSHHDSGFMPLFNAAYRIMLLILHSYFGV